MKKSLHFLSSEQAVADRAHLAWCALVALRLEQRAGQAQSALTIHTFLLRWLAVAQKQRRFPRSVAPDIDSLLRLGRQQGPCSGLQQQLEFLWKSYSCPVKQQPDLLRLTYAIEKLKAQGWLNAVVTDEEWEPPVLQAEYADVPALLVRKSELMRNFAEDGSLLETVDFLVTGDADTVAGALNLWSLRYKVQWQQADCCGITLIPE
ncbi:TPA: DUF2913 family protein [Salmonella enterica]|uniref:DUF2913 family protein n=1 Tax=Salmonella enterica TaxID=28901 RepID=A0A743P4Y7_SALER|nr:DUF2913 family protein [Salmonella enterica]HEA0252146.1 DUF2913 family protein [Salmonella enterica]HEA0390777.1 DUF2913 family protein [Salmonella enterica]